MSAGALAPRERGRTELADRVVEKIAARAAGEVPGVLGGPADRETGARAPRAAGRVRDWRASLRVTLGCAYPAPVVPITTAVRERLAQRLAELAGVEIVDLDIVVDQLGAPLTPTGRVR